VRFLFDANLPPDLAHAIRELCTSEPGVDEVIHLSDKFPRSTPDLAWIPALGQGWYIISIDKFAKSRGQEREALRRAGHTVYVLDPQWSKHAFWLKSSRLVLWWPQVLEHARLTAGGGFRIPWQHTSSKKFQGL
jgi:PIN like domain